MAGLDPTADGSGHVSRSLNLESQIMLVDILRACDSELSLMSVSSTANAYYFDPKTDRECHVDIERAQLNYVPEHGMVFQIHDPKLPDQLKLDAVKKDKKVHYNSNVDLHYDEINNFQNALQSEYGLHLTLVRDGNKIALLPLDEKSDAAIPTVIEKVSALLAEHQVIPPSDRPTFKPDRQLYSFKEFIAIGPEAEAGQKPLGFATHLNGRSRNNLMCSDALNHVSGVARPVAFYMFKKPIALENGAIPIDLHTCRFHRPHGYQPVMGIAFDLDTRAHVLNAAGTVKASKRPISGKTGQGDLTLNTSELRSLIGHLNRTCRTNIGIYQIGYRQSPDGIGKMIFIPMDEASERKLPNMVGEIDHLLYTLRATKVHDQELILPPSDRGR